MKKQLFPLLLFLFVGKLKGEEKPFVFVIASYNNSQRYERNLNSVFFQNYENFKVIYVDDASTDGTGDLVEEYRQARHLEGKLRLIKNKTRQGALANKYNAIWLCLPSEIIVELDGDDWLAHSWVLKKFNQIYTDGSVWLTYGRLLFHPTYELSMGWEISKEEIEQNAFRSIHGTGTTPLRTFYAGLFHRIKKEDLLFEGNFFPVASDLAFMFPMLEMAGHHIKFVDEINYIYDVGTSLNDHVLRGAEQIRFDNIIRSRPKYLPLETLDEK